MRLIDTHAHLTDPVFEDLDAYLKLAIDADVKGVLSIATTLDDAKLCVQQAQKYDAIKAAVGLHPNTCCKAASTDWDEIVELSRAEGVVALGETGLDKHWDDCPWDVQVDIFKRHLSLSRETELPVVIHTRDCAEETLEVLRQEAQLGPLKGVMHSFTGPLAVAEGCLELGLYISFAGMVTFKNAADIREIAKRVPEDRILVETDSPYLTPDPHRGKRPNHPAMVRHTLEHVAKVREVSTESFAEITTANAERLFGSWG